MKMPTRIIIAMRAMTIRIGDDDGQGQTNGGSCTETHDDIINNLILFVLARLFVAAVDHDREQG